MVSFLNKSFQEMLDNSYELLNNENNNKFKLILPNFNIKIEITRLQWFNVYDFLNILNRPSEHFINFLKYELNNKNINWINSNSIEDGLIIHGKKQSIKDIKDIVNKYINYFVICISCKKYNSILDKFTSIKYNFKCLDCGMTKCI